MSDAEKNLEKPKTILAEIQEGLENKEVDERLESINALSALGYSSGVILDLLEKIAIKDRSKRVRAAALTALDLPVHKQIFSRRSKLDKVTRGILLGEIRRWKKDGLLDTDIAVTLEKRYAFDLLEKRNLALEGKTPKVEKPKRTLGQVLFSESSIKIALYLGAFFVIAAAAIFAAAIESLRLPILLFFTLLFGLGSLSLKKKLSQPSFTLFIVFSVLLPIDFNVIADILNFKAFANSAYWMIVFAFMAVIWAFSTWFFRSRFFSITSFIALGTFLFHFTNLFDGSPIDLYLLMFALLALVGLGASRVLVKWQDEKFSRPLFWLTQTHEILLLASSFFAFLFRYDDSSFGNAWWLVSVAIWLLAVIFYIFSDRQKTKSFFHILAVLSAMPIAWLFMNVFGASEGIQAISFLFWGALYALIGEILDARKDGKFHHYGQMLILGSAPLVAMSAFLGVAESETIGFSLFLAGTILYFLLTLYRSRLWTWSLALVTAISAYFIFFQLGFARNLNIYLGFKLLFPALLLLSPEIFFKKTIKEKLNWRLPPIALGTLLLSVNTVIALSALHSESWKAAAIFAIFAILLLGYAFRYYLWLAYASNFYFALGLLYLLRHLEVDRWLFPFIALATFYYLLGWVFEKRENTAHWANVYRYSALTLATILSLSAPLEDSGLIASIPVVLAAGLFTIEAFRKRNLWLGFPANILYLMAYFMILLNFEVDQPQFYSLAVAALGMLMHYLLVRSGSKTAAFITGMLSQLVLLSTTYFQLVAEEQFLYFVVLFFQALAVLIYGIVSRSKSLVITPIIFLVLSVLTITFGLLEGWPTIFLIGCTGVFLIAFGIGALLLREQVATLRDKLDDWSA